MKQTYPSLLVAGGLLVAVRLWNWLLRPNRNQPSVSWQTLGLTGLVVLLAMNAQAQQRAAPALFREDGAAQAAAVSSPLAAALFRSRALTLDVPAMRATLAAAPLESRAGAPLELVLPLPDGRSARFAVVEAPLMEPTLAARFPAIRTYRGVGLDNPMAAIRLDFTPLGFHAQIITPGESTVYIDPVSLTDQQHYLSFFRHDMNRSAASRAVCGVQGAPTAAAPGVRRNTGGGGSGPALLATGPQLRTYRLAVAATGEYTATKGGTVAGGQAGIVTTMNRVVGVFELELAIRMVLVGNNSSVVYTNGGTDPYTNNDPNALLTQNQSNLDAVIGSANYDIGHVFSTDGGGLAILGAVCRNGLKAQGETGLANPSGDVFAIDYVSHEMGHQFGANHTFNSGGTTNCSDAGTAGTRNANTAYEPGSGSTIMAYAGICDPDNLQPNSDAYFHVASYEEIETYVTNNPCGTTAPTGNTVPVVTIPASGEVLPMNTPFKLTASATDANGDALTYCWEEYDLGPAGAPLAPQVNGQTNPLFRSFLPTASPTRYFPRLTNLVANTSNIGERLPTVNRALKFRVTVRDQHNGTQGVVGGINSSPTVNLSVTTAAGPFVVTTPNTAVTWAGNSSQTVTWDVAGTTGNGVNCAIVNILLSTDGGFTYPTTLLAGTANDGTQAVTVPNVSTTQARVMVEAADNYFFDISNANFTITAVAACNAPTSLAVGSVTQTTASVSFTASSSATSYTVTTSPATTTQTVTASPVSLTGLSASTNYTVNIVSNCSGGQTSAAATATFTTAAPPCNAPTSLTAGSVTQTTASISFTASSSATTYTVTTSPATTTQTVNSSPVSLMGLSANTAYTVSIVSNCSGGQTSSAATVSFTTAAAPCNAPTSLTAGSVTQTSASVSFTASSSATSYTVTTSPATTTQTVSSSPVTFSGLTASTTYTVSIVSNCSGGQTSAAATTSFTTSAAPCDAPTSLAAGSVTQTSASISFAPSSSATTYTVTTSPVTTTQTVSSSPVSLTGLSAGTTYTVSIVSNCSGGQTSAAATTSFTTQAATPGTCDAPTNVAAGSVTSNSASISFTPSGSASNYTVTTSPATTTQTITTSPVSLTGLSASTTYTVSIVSNCSGGLTSSAGTTSFTTLAPPPGDLTVSGAQNVSGTYNNVTITSTGIATVTAALTVNGTLTVQSGGQLLTNCQPISGPGNFTLAAGGRLSICDAAGISASGATGAIQLAGTRSFSTEASYVYNGTATQATGPGLPATVLNLGINNTSNVALTQSLTIGRLLNIQAGDLTLGSSNLLLRSDASGTAMVINRGTGRVQNTGTGRATMQRYITLDPAQPYTGPGYRHYSSPVQLTTVADLAVPGLFTPLVDPAYNALPTPVLPAAQFPNVFSYNESRLTATYATFDTGWQSPTSTSEVLAPTRGYTVNIVPAATVDLSGLLQTGAVNTGPLTRSFGPDAGWQLLGNPYPAPLNWDTVTTISGALPAGLNNAIYVFEPTAQYAGFYRSYVNGVGTGGFDGVVPAMQGFFMRTTQNVPGGFTFQNSFRATGYRNPAFHRSTLTADSRPLVRLALHGTDAATALTGTDETVVYLEPGATVTGTDTRFDAAKIANPGSVLSIATQMPGPGNELLAINGLPLMPNAATPVTRVPLVLQVPQAGAYRFTTVAAANFNATQTVHLLDHATGITTNLRQQPAYACQLAAGTVRGRFELLLGQLGSATATTASVASQFSVWPNPTRGQTAFQVGLSLPASSATCTLHTLLGQVVRRHTFMGSTTAVPTAGLATGTYLLTVQVADQAPVTRRVVVE